MDKKQLYKEIILRSTTTPVGDRVDEITRITSYVYLGSFNNVASLPPDHTFRYIVNMSMMRYTPRGDNVTVINLPIPDNDTVRIRRYFDVVADFLEKCERHRTPVLVHCVAGVNRSGAVIMAYLLRTKNKNIPTLVYFLYVYHELKRIRGAFLENRSFKDQLLDHYL
ncbi:Tyr/Ser phosphatase IFN-gamma inhibitor [Western grey kangaroopox virus]|uniref:Tyr/Ser phosphatase IFN-gamma inhibitor n=1 Tax=Western grey kangaroopox virus TaxID=1566307 RepID=A0A2C9DSN3_9POXV|nr:Tyr/Ser phosphatase IFN-gamma inhibitor [Western grey kangaroopox virus]ATI21016.1 Tyr/Ser phosphatase IFN-gamma inhibitor [Western grey kangaroopox virus]